MFSFGEKKPVLFEIILFIVAFLAAAVFTVFGSALNLSSELSSSIGRIIVGLLLCLIYRKRLLRGSFSSGLVYTLPALLFVVWNIFYNLSSGQTFGDAEILIAGLITAIAPAIFEEIIFRGIFISNLQKKGYGAMACMLTSAVFFAAVHMTNIAGMELLNVAVQVGYSLVIGMVLAAIYLKNGSLTQIVLIHFLIDFFNRIYNGSVTTSSNLQMVIFAIVLIGEAVYALVLTKNAGKEAGAE